MRSFLLVFGLPLVFADSLLAPPPGKGPPGPPSWASLITGQPAAQTGSPQSAPTGPPWGNGPPPWANGATGPPWGKGPPPWLGGAQQPSGQQSPPSQGAPAPVTGPGSLSGPPSFGPQPPRPNAPASNGPPPPEAPGPAQAAGSGGSLPSAFKLIEGQTSQNSLKFSIALPKSASESRDDFIGILNGKGIGWGAVGVGHGMLSKVLIAVEPNASGVKGSLRYTSSYGIPPILSSANISIKAMPGYSFVENGGWTYTFLCQGCLALNRNDNGFSDKSKLATFGYAFHTKANAIQGKHTANGQISVTLDGARTDGYAEFARNAA
ncbi:CBD9-like protein [Microthyrium microscopicum]|uniref:CBD9-like protein n=1 Tax=Microthyrium microscopicum TaxID=703497 RepID=A0A6A6US29_9PEZI|nr:CBD9-like protein [Microthyrium microscopicum]